MVTADVTALIKRSKGWQRSIKLAPEKVHWFICCPNLFWAALPCLLVGLSRTVNTQHILHDVIKSRTLLKPLLIFRMSLLEGEKNGMEALNADWSETSHKPLPRNPPQHCASSGSTYKSLDFQSWRLRHPVRKERLYIWDTFAVCNTNLLKCSKSCFNIFAHMKARQSNDKKLSTETLPSLSRLVKSSAFNHRAQSTLL